MFADMGETFAQHAARGGLQLRRVPLNLSFRAVEPLLAAVDGVFADRARTPGLTAAATPIRHVAHRAGHAGLIEIWPTEKADQVKPAEPWSPLAEAAATSPVARLADAHRPDHPRLAGVAARGSRPRTGPSAPATS